MRLAKRVEELPPYLFAQNLEGHRRQEGPGIDVITFGIGDPDLHTAPISSTRSIAPPITPPTTATPSPEGLPELRQAISDWYERRFEVSFDPEREALALIGSKEGIAHMRSPSSIPAMWPSSPTRATPSTRFGTMFAGGASPSAAAHARVRLAARPRRLPEDLGRQGQGSLAELPEQPDPAAVADLAFFERSGRLGEGVRRLPSATTIRTARGLRRLPSDVHLPRRRAARLRHRVQLVLEDLQHDGWRIGMCVAATASSSTPSCASSLEHRQRHPQPSRRWPSRP